jgi:Tfp pilus assembly protein PilV
MTHILLRKQKGQGLIEIVITIAVILGSAIALLRLQNSILYSDSFIRQQNYAMLLATQQIETLRTFTTLSGTGSYQTIASGSSTVSGPTATYTLTWTVTTLTNPNYKVVNITVSWVDKRGATQSIQVATQMAGIDPAYSASII